ncbi:LacI family transcriptional regulator [Paraburkholderia sp. Cy-641]|uniref:LacI family DNA-binding transcriptional regulator n=1 Tax=Paraburkholderia sp. Cy-641 TaxID=2608337 RepID=UPI00141E1FAD|nr:LacI family DNA-binding transcriptional regulator [Paraburkholderia sp. Cy-641]NIF79236.1 LacI family transcriptional regulator [Paraburkholderia sp. Cy-641]
MTRATITAIAEAAGVSTATVDRVLNGREGVRSHTRDHVLAVARKLGHAGEADQGAQAGIRLSFVLPAGDNSFMSLLHQHLLVEAQCRPEVQARMHLVEGFNAEKLAAQLHQLKGNTDAVGLVGLDHPQVRDAIAALQASGVHVCTLVSDIPTSARMAYVGIDNRAAGRLAAWLLGRFLPQGVPQEVAVFLGSLAYRGHEEREMGFRALLSEEFPHIRIARMLEIGDDRARAYELTRQMLQQGTPAGIYNIGAGNSGIGRALQETGLQRQIMFVGHDLTHISRQFLLDRTMDAVIEQNPRVEAREAVRLLASAVRGQTEPTYMPRLQVIFRENIPLS